MEKHPYYFKRDAVEVSMAVQIEEVVVVEDLKNEIIVEEQLEELMTENYY